MRFHKFLFEDLYGQQAEKILFDLSQKHDKTEMLKKLQVQLSSNRDNPQKSKEISKAIQILLRNKKPIGKPIEDFQKKLWLKKKFVVATNYCITLDRIPEEFYPAIAANEAQRQEWARLFAIDEITEIGSGGGAAA